MIKEVKQIVTNILKEDIRTRDNDDILLATVWWKQQLGTEIERLSAVDFLKRFSRGEFPKPEGVTRCRRKIQEMNPDLRGHKYEKRKKSMTESVKKEVREMEIGR